MFSMQMQLQIQNQKLFCPIKNTYKGKKSFRSTGTRKE
jgi:hypothetical protein